MPGQSKTPQHTPGEWRLETNRGGFVQVVGAGGPIAIVSTRVGCEEADANARLLSAAPDLFAVVEKWIELRDGGPQGLTSAGEWLTRLEAAGRLALAKARGV